MARHWPDGTWGVRAQNGKPLKRNPTALDLAIGDGRYGYPTWRDREGVKQVEAFDGQALLKSSRRTAARHKKPGSKLVSSTEARGRNGLADFERVVPSLLEEVRRVASRPRFRARKGQKP